jgi:NADPH-dependent glutamate synthase beta subunit-like oxidoreductase
MKRSADDMTRAPDLSMARRSNLQRGERPVYVDRLPPCNSTCPAGENVQAWLSLLRAGDDEGAFRVILRDNPLPATMGRVCYHTCESACNRKDLDSAVTIHGAERFLGDRALERGWKAEAGAPTGKRVLVVGAGPSGLSAAYHLRRAGHEVVIRDAGPMAGGMMHFGIPRYRLPREVLDAEIARIVDMGVELRLNSKVESLSEAKSGFDAVFLAVGAHLSRRVGIPALDASRVLDAIGYLKEVEHGERPLLGRRVAIYGGGNTAIDAARTARRLGAEETLLVYRRTRDMAPAHDWEIEEAAEEGIRMHWLRTIKSVGDGVIEIERMELDEKGWPQPTGEVETLAADSLILALGQETDTAFLDGTRVERERDGTVIVDGGMMTAEPGVFAGGDMVPYERSVTVAIGHGKRAARHIDAYLKGQRVGFVEKHRDVPFSDLNLWFSTDAPEAKEARLAPDVRAQGFDEVVSGFDEKRARYEAERCLSCGNCFECDGCLAACKDDAVIKLGKGNRYRFDYDKCTGCRSCFEQCPCGAIVMEPEPSAAALASKGA